jgi:hypothetical protein
MKDDLIMFGQVSGRVIKADGTELPFAINNLIVATGKTYAVGRLYTNDITPISHMGIGRSPGLPESSQTALLEEIAARQQVTAAVTNNNIKFSANFTNITDTVAEIGLFNANTAGLMFARALIGPFPLQATDTLALDWNVNVP